MTQETAYWLVFIAGCIGIIIAVMGFSILDSSEDRWKNDNDP
jgi:hypothetical protein